MRKEKLEELKGYIADLKTVKMTKLNKINSDKGFLNIEKYTCILNNGHTICREKILKDKKNGNAAIVIPITNEGNTVLVVQPRVFTEETVGIEFPAGYIEENEKPIDATRRKLIEETGYFPTEMKMIASYYQDQGCMSSLNHSFIAFGCEKKQIQNLDDDEFIKYFECSYEEAIELMEMGYIKDANSLIILEKSKKYIKELI